MVHVHYLYNLQCVCVQNCQSRLNLRTQTDTNMYHSSTILSHIDCLTSTLHIHLCIRQQTCRPQTQQLPTHSTIHACTYTQHDIMRSYHFAKSSCVLFCKTWVHEIGLKSCNIYTHSATHYPRVSRNISTQVARARDFYTQTLHRHMTSILWHAVKRSHWFCTRLTFQRRPQTSGWFHRRVFFWQVPSAPPQHVTSTSINNNNKNRRHMMHNDVVYWHATKHKLQTLRVSSAASQSPVWSSWCAPAARMT